MELKRRPFSAPILEIYFIREQNRRWKEALILGFGGILGSASRAEFPVSPSNHVGCMPRFLYSNTHHSSESFIQLKTG